MPESLLNHLLWRGGQLLFASFAESIPPVAVWTWNSESPNWMHKALGSKGKETAVEAEGRSWNANMPWIGGGHCREIEENLTVGRHLVGVWIGGVWNGHFPESEKYFSEAEFCRKIPEILQKERFLPHFRLRNLKIQSPKICNSTPPAIPLDSLPKLGRPHIKPERQGQVQEAEACETPACETPDRSTNSGCAKKPRCPAQGQEWIERERENKKKKKKKRWKLHPIYQEIKSFLHKMAIRNPDFKKVHCKVQRLLSGQTMGSTSLVSSLKSVLMALKRYFGVVLYTLWKVFWWHWRAIVG